VGNDVGGRLRLPSQKNRENSTSRESTMPKNFSELPRINYWNTLLVKDKFKFICNCCEWFCVHLEDGKGKKKSLKLRSQLYFVVFV
jgi:hypothetical protein